MTSHTYELELGFETPSRLRTISAKQYDQQSRYISIHFSDGLEEYTLSQDMTAYLKAKKPDGTYVYRDNTLKAKDPAGNIINELAGDIAIDTANNIIVIELTEQMLAVPGIVHCEIVLQENKQILTSDYFDIQVLPSVLPAEALKSETDYSSLSNAVEKISALDMGQVQHSLDNLDTIINAADTAVKKAKEAGNSAAAAKTSEEKSKVYENNALSYMNTSSVCAFNAKESQTDAKKSELSSKQSEENAFNHMGTASICAYNAKQSQTNAEESENNSRKYKDDAFQYMSTASVCAFNAKESETAAGNSAALSQEYYEKTKQAGDNAINGINGAIDNINQGVPKFWINPDDGILYHTPSRFTFAINRVTGQLEWGLTV